MKVLLDSNAIIYLQTPFQSQIAAWLTGNEVFASLISYPEVLGFAELTLPEETFFKAFFQRVSTVSVSEEILAHAASFRRRRKTTLGDAIVAATADLYDLTIVTANTRDFRKFPELRLVNPLVESRF